MQCTPLLLGCSPYAQLKAHLIIVICKDMNDFVNLYDFNDILKPPPNLRFFDK